MTRSELIALVRAHRFAVEATSHVDGGPQAAVVGIAITDDCEIVFDTVTTSRKYQNLRRDPRCALVVWQGEQTVQIEGVADVPEGDELERVRACYLAAFPEGRERMQWPDIVYVRVRPRWARASDFAATPPRITELAL